jgi:hypothetical protein
MVGLKARLRAWLIDLVREAIHEQLMQDFPTVRQSTEMASIVPGKIPTIVYVDPKPASKPVTVSEPSFEQMQAAAIQEQEKYYAPVERL